MPADDVLVCSTCTTAVLRKNMTRHRVRCRIASGGDDESLSSREELRCRTTSIAGAESRSRSSSTGSSASRSCGGLAGQPTRPTSHTLGDSADPVPITPSGCGASTLHLMEVARALLDQHHAFTEAQLCNYVAEAYPEVPPEVRRGLVIGAVAGAQHAAHLRYIIMDNKDSPDADKRKMAAHAASSLSFWGLGFRQRPRPVPSASDTRRTSRSTSVSPRRDEADVAKEVKTADAQTSPKGWTSFDDIQLPVMPCISDVEFDVINRAAEIACRPFASLFRNHPVETGAAPATDQQSDNASSSNANQPPIMTMGSEVVVEDTSAKSHDPAVVTSSESVDGRAASSASRCYPKSHGGQTPSSDPVITLDAPSDVDDASVRVRSPVRRTKATDQGSIEASLAAKKTNANPGTTAADRKTPTREHPRRASPVKNRQPRTSMEFRSPLEKLESGVNKPRFQRNRRRSPRANSRSPRRDENRRRASPERLVLTGRDLIEYRKMMDSKRHNS